MNKNKIPLTIGLALKAVPPEAVDAGAEFSFSVLANWPEGIAAKDASYVIRDGERILASGNLPEPGGNGIALKVVAPEEAGEHRLRFVVESGDAKGSLEFALKVVPHETSLAAWDIPSPVVRGALFAVKVGAKCTASCALGGRTVEIRDEAGKLMGSGALKNATWEGTAALYWTTLDVKAPKKLKLHGWTANFSGAGLKLPHDAGTAGFSFVVVSEPEHCVSIKVVDKVTKAPIAGAQVRLGLYRAVTGENGAVRLRVPKGEFPLVVTRAGYEMPERNLAVAKDVRVRVAAEALPEEDPFAMWTA